MPDIVIYAAPQAYAASLGCVLDAYALITEVHQANMSSSAYPWRMVSRTRILTRDGGPVLLAGGRALAADGGISAELDARLIYLAAFHPGIVEDGHACPPFDPGLNDWLRRQRARGAILAGSGASVWPLAKAGLLDGETVAVEPRFAEAFRRAFPRLKIDPLQAMSTAADVMTCASPALEREFVTRAFARAIAPGVGEWLTLRWGEAVEAGIAVPQDPLVQRAQLWIRERYTTNFRIQDLAASLSVSHATLIRRFRQAMGATPRAYAQGLRIQAACMMLRETPRSVSNIAALVGYSDLPTFREVFRAHLGQAPANYRMAVRARRTLVKTPP
ncbi:MAG: helix-turn-helix domain-containing protein [Caulobacteraceae bacterium]|nr:helix-turn-helix domain-containing protein [Caulobacteraceae bacterium]